MKIKKILGSERLKIYLDNFSVILREKFDHTEWRKNFFDDIDAKEFNESAAEYSRKNPFRTCLKSSENESK